MATRLWDDYDGIPFMENPKRHRRRRSGRKRRPPKGFRSWKAYMASIRPNPKGRSGTVARRRKRRRHRRNPESRRTRVLAARRGARRRSRRSFRRNPSIVSQVTRGLSDGFFVVLGKAAARSIPGFVGINSRTGVMGAAVQGLTGILVGMVGGRFLGSERTRMLVAGAWSGAVESLVTSFNIPVLSPALASGVSSYPRVGMRSYPPALRGIPSEVPELNIPDQVVY